MTCHFKLNLSFKKEKNNDTENFHFITIILFNPYMLQMAFSFLI